MNSLAYVSRKFDVLLSSSPRTPPSTPASECPPFHWHRRRSSDSSSLKRTKTWSDKSLSPSPSPPEGPSPPRPKRSYSIPSAFFPPSPQLPSQPSSPSGAPVDRIIPPKPKLRLRFRSAWRRVSLLRVFVFVWNTLCATWISWFPAEIESKARNVPNVSMRENALHPDYESHFDATPSTLPSIPRPPAPDTPSDPPHRLARSTVQPLPTPPPTPECLAQQPSLPSPPADTTSRVPTPTNAHKTPFHFPKTLVLDLDETLIHSTSKPLSHSSGPLGLLALGRRNKGHTVEVILGGRHTLYHVYKRPFVDYFLRKVSGWYTLVVFTASMEEYADPVIDWLDAGRGILTRRFFRESCTLLPNGSYTKDLSIVEQDLARICLIDNSPISYRVNEANGIPIEGWTHDPSDEALLDLLPILDSLRFTSDVRSVLGLRGFSS
ncbi:NIF-domain-containing protein [Pisolithus tinctorius]|nr:NIF-domain-containing protein [Pisolithus tinctorius]